MNERGWQCGLWISLAVAATLLVTGCSRYAHFTLPAAPDGNANPALKFTWDVAPEPVFPRGVAGEFDSIDALNPSIPMVGQHGEFEMLYSGFDGKAWHTGIFESLTDGTTRKNGKILSPDPATWEGDYIAANGSAIFFNHGFHYWYQGGRLAQIGLAVRELGEKRWNRHGPPVLTPGPVGSWDERGVADPYVVQFGDALYLYYTGMDRAARQRLGVARSTDGVHWEKSLDNPILEVGGLGEFDEGGLGEPAVWQSHGRYWMLYTGRAWDERRAIGLAESADGVIWRRSNAAPLLAGRPGTWMSHVVCDPTVIPRGGRVLVWFGGGNVASPDERLNGQIGFATLEVLAAAK